MVGICGLSTAGIPTVLRGSNCTWCTVAVLASSCRPWPELVDISGIAEGTSINQAWSLLFGSSPHVCRDPGLGYWAGATDRQLACRMVSPRHVRNHVHYSDSPRRADDVPVFRRWIPELYARDWPTLSAFTVIGPKRPSPQLRRAHRASRRRFLIAFSVEKRAQIRASILTALAAAPSVASQRMLVYGEWKELACHTS